MTTTLDQLCVDSLTVNVDGVLTRLWTPEEGLIQSFSDVIHLYYN